MNGDFQMEMITNDQRPFESDSDSGATSEIPHRFNLYGSHFSSLKQLKNMVRNGSPGKLEAK
jgi:hypothetical protein